MLHSVTMVKEESRSEELGTFNLSEKIAGNVIFIFDVKEFIRLLKEAIERHKLFPNDKDIEFSCVSADDIIEEIDKLAGEKLI